MGEMEEITINYKMNIENNKLEITFFIAVVDAFKDNKKSIGQTNLIIKDGYINVIKMIDNILGKKYNIVGKNLRSFN